MFVAMYLLSGCDLANTPTSRVEDLLMDYQMLENNIPITYTELTNNIELSDDYQLEYEKLIKEQYRNLTYEIKNEEINGEIAIVTVEIEVTDYGKVINQYDISNYETDTEYHKNVLQALKNTKDKITYTIDFVASKTQNDVWEVQELDSENKEKLLGMN